MFNKICDKIKYLISKKSGSTDGINYNFGRIRIDSYNSLPIKKILTFHNVFKFQENVTHKICTNLKGSWAPANGDDKTLVVINNGPKDALLKNYAHKKHLLLQRKRSHYQNDLKEHS